MTTTPADLLGPAEPVRRTPGRASNALAAVVAAGAVLVGGSGVAVAFAYSGGGLQPEDVLPASAVAYADLDLDPSARQKEQLLSLAERFPSLKTSATTLDGLRTDLLEQVLVDEDLSADDLDWVGDRLGVAAVPAKGTVAPLAAVAFTDRAKAESFLTAEAEKDDAFHFAFSELGDYVLIGGTQQQADAAIDPADVLGDLPAFRDALARLDGGQVVTVWTDIGRVWAALPAGDRASAAQSYGLPDGVTPSGQVVAGLHAVDAGLELAGRTVDLVTGPGGAQVTGAEKLVEGLPSSTVAAAGFAGLGPRVAEQLDALSSAFGPGVGAGDGTDGTDGTDGSGILDGFGLSLPDDLVTLLGDRTVVAAFDDQGVAARSRTPDPAAAARIVRTLLTNLTGTDSSELVATLSDGIAAGTTPEAVDAVSGSGGPAALGRSKVFRRAVPEAADSSVVLFVDVAKALAAAGEDFGSPPKDLQALEAVGFSADATSFRLRVTLR